MAWPALSVMAGGRPPTRMTTVRTVLIAVSQPVPAVLQPNMAAMARCLSVTWPDDERPAQVSVPKVGDALPKLAASFCEALTLTAMGANGQVPPLASGQVKWTSRFMVGS